MPRLPEALRWAAGGDEVVERNAAHTMQKAPRATRSKKSLPAAFCSRTPQPVLRVERGVGDLATDRSDPTAAALSSGGTIGAAIGAAATDTSSWDPSFPSQPPMQQQHMLHHEQQAGGRRRDPIRLDSLVFLGPCSQRHGHFAVKKMLHPPTLGLFCLVELPGAQREVLRASLQDWLQKWCAHQARHPDLLLEVCEAYWDAPQGYPVGILCEYMPLGTLDELVQACGGLPEEALREIAQVVLEALDTLHSESPPQIHGCLKPSHVLFCASGRPKLTFGLEQRLKGCQMWPPIPGQPDNCPAADGKEEGAVDEQSPAVDIFDLGMLLLVSALGGLDVLLDAIPYAREFGSRSTRAVSADTCALLAHELRGAYRLDAGLEDRGQAAGLDMGYLPPAADLLFNRRYSEPFLSFVSKCLEAHMQSAPVSARNLLQHKFLREQPAVGPLVSLREMQALARLLNEAPAHDPSRFGPGKSSRSWVPGVAPSVAQSAQLYLMNIAQSIAPHCGEAAAPRWRDQEWDTLLTDTARTLGLSKAVVQEALQTQVERLMRGLVS